MQARPTDMLGNDAFTELSMALNIFSVDYLVWRAQSSFTFGSFLDEYIQKKEGSQKELQDTTVYFLMHMM